MGYNGRSCVLRALCESAQYFYEKSTNMVEELVRTVFTYVWFSISAFVTLLQLNVIFLCRLPSTKVLPFEHKDLPIYDKAYRKGNDRIYCSSMYPDCSFSLIELALGAYSNPFNFMWNGNLNFTNKYCFAVYLDYHNFTLIFSYNKPWKLMQQ